MLITEGDNVGVLAVVRGLRRAGYEPWVLAAGRNAPATTSRAAAGSLRVCDPATDATAFADQVAAIARRLAPVAVLPGGEKSMLALAGCADLMPNGSLLALCDRPTVALATDKAELVELAAGAGLRSPETFPLSAEAAARDELPVGLPAIVKPVRSELSSAGGFLKSCVSFARSREDVIDALRVLPSGHGLVQPYHDGSLTSLSGVFSAGAVLGATHQRALRVWPRGCGEMAYAVSLPRDSELELAAGRLLARLGWSGLFQIQFIETAQDRLLIDLNPRVYGSLALALAAGQNLPALWVESLLGKSSAATPYREGVTFRNELLDAQALLARPREGTWPEASKALMHRATIHAFFAPGDPMPLLALAPRLGAKLSSRARNGQRRRHAMAA